MMRQEVFLRVKEAASRSRNLWSVLAIARLVIRYGRTRRPTRTFTLLGSATPVGSKYQFLCRNCDYQATVSGGADVGMLCRKTTINCQDCDELFDVVTSEKPWDESATLPDDELVCPRFKPGRRTKRLVKGRSNVTHRVRRWTFPEPCPKRGQAMSQGDLVMMWD